MTRGRAAALRALLLACYVVAACGTPAPGPVAGPPADADDEARDLLIAVDDRPELQAVPGGTPRGGYGGASYAGSTRALADTQALAEATGARAVAGWTIAGLQWRCTRLRLPPGADREAALRLLAADPRVRLAQPVNRYDALQTPPVNRYDALQSPPTPAAVPVRSTATAATDPALAAYNDPYARLQQAFAALHAPAAQRWSQGEGVAVALVDTGVDAAHPDLAGRVALQRDFVPAHPAAPGGEAHGTAMAGVIAAGANNRVGIVGLAPAARLLVYRACWPVQGGAARCDSYTLARALSAALGDGADVINLSLGGPPDPLLQRLAEQALAQGRIVVGALPPGGRLAGFPAGVAGVLVAAPSEGEAVPGALRAPGREVLTLTPGGHYDYLSGASIATAQASGVVALMRALQPRLTAATAAERLPAAAGAAIDACEAVRRSGPPALAACPLPAPKAGS